MKINRKKAAAVASVAVAAVMTCGLFAGCDLVTRNETANMNQTVAEVNIKKSEKWNEEFQDLNKALADKVISTTSVSKRDMIVSFINSGYNSSIMNSYNWSYKDVFDSIANGLAQRQANIQYAKAYFLKNGWTDEDGNKIEYNDLAKFNEYVKDENGVELTGTAYDVAACGYFLTQEERDKADYATRVMLNNNIDSIEKRDYIKEEEDKKEYDTDVRTTPTGLNTADSDYYDNEYRVYTGTGKQNSVRGTYEAQEGSTAFTRRSAYQSLIGTLDDNNLVRKGEDTSDIESLNYFMLEQKAGYESALLSKLGDVFTKQAEEKVTESFCNEQFVNDLKTQRDKYAASTAALEEAMKSVSDTNFVLTATGDEQEESAFGFVINILLPFSTAQSDELNSVKQDFGDKKGNKFVTRATLLKNLKATDRRGSWFRGETDYSFKATSADDAYGYNAGEEKPREWLFFEDNLIEETSKYERLKNYLGKYTYNGTWDEETRKYKPYQIDIDGFLAEMEGYLSSEFALGSGAVTTVKDSRGGYFANGGYYKSNGDVDYQRFVYYEGKVNFGNFNANEIFKKGSKENTAMSVINELSFAYNTDTGNLNSYLGYPITANKTEFVNEFEYASQKVVLAGAGNYIVVPSDYGWHIIYCTFSFVNTHYGYDQGPKTPFNFDYSQKDEEGTFSNLYYEKIKASTDSEESSNRSSLITAFFKDSFEIFEERYSDLSSIGSNN